jgi:DNA-directed RNA polymerase specialized sigma24 family protein
MRAATGDRRIAPKSPPTDFDGWRQVVAEEDLGSYRQEDIVAALQRLGPSGDKRLVEALMGYINDEIMRLLRKIIGTNHRNKGRDMIERAHGKLIDAVLLPRSKDGAGLRVAFRARIDFRAADAIAAERRETSRYQAYELDEEGTPCEPPDSSPVDIHETAYVEQLLSRIPDHRKRLAFRLHMEGCPKGKAAGKGNGTTSIAQALGVTEKTVRTWIAEIQDLLKGMGVTNEQA